MKLLGIVLIVVGGSMILGTLFPLIGSVFALAFVLVKLAISGAITYLGYRFLTRDEEAY
tara:strand:- start:8811 stop:8987 length:177 start_codon:yes stop_codon:yes gene_type:complete